MAYDCQGRGTNSSWRKGCRCPGCIAAHSSWLAYGATMAAAKRAQSEVDLTLLCPIHDAEVYDVCRCSP